HALERFARRTEESRIAFEPDREHDVLRVERRAVRELQHEVALRAGNLRDFAAVADVDLVRAQVVAPARENLFARTGVEFEIAAQIEEARLRHDVLPFLVALNRLGVGVETLEQDVARARAASLAVERRGARSRAQTRGPGADDRDMKLLHRHSYWDASPE